MEGHEEEAVEALFPHGNEANKTHQQCLFSRDQHNPTVNEELEWGTGLEHRASVVGRLYLYVSYAAAKLL